MKKLFLLFFLMVAGCAGMQKVPQEQTMSVTKVIEVPGMTKQQIFSKTLTWVDRYLKPEGADLSSGLVLADGEVAYPSPPVGRVEYTFVFQMKSEIRDNTNTVKFERVMLKAPKEYLTSDSPEGKRFMGGEESPITSKKDFEAAQNALLYISDNLADFLK